MTPVALIVEYQTPDLLELCLASLARFAPEVTPVVLPGGPGAEYHGEAIEAWIDDTSGLADPVILLDTDTVILDEEWWPALAADLEAGHDLIGGLRSRGEACQMFSGETPMLHASMLVMTRRLACDIETFKAQPFDLELECIVLDTAHRASFLAKYPKIYPYWPVTEGPIFPGLQVGEYFQPGSLRTLWSHLWRGTGMPAGGPLRQSLRRVRAACGSRSARTVLRAQARKEAWMRRAWEIVRA